MFTPYYLKNHLENHTLWRAALDPHFTCLVQKIPLYFLFCRWGSESSEKVTDLPKIIQLEIGRLLSQIVQTMLALAQTRGNRRFLTTTFKVQDSSSSWLSRRNWKILLPGAEDMAADGWLSRGGPHGVCGQGQSTTQPGLQTAFWLGAEDGDIISRSRMQDSVIIMTITVTAITRQSVLSISQALC